MESTLIQHLMTTRWRWFILSLLVLIVSSAGLRHFSFDSSTGFFFGEDHPQMERWNAFIDIYGEIAAAVQFFNLQAKRHPGQSPL